MKNPVWVSGSNYFNERDLKNMISLLDNGKAIHVGIDCVGHTRNNMEQEAYKSALEEHYGNRLEVQTNNGWCSYSYEYRLK